METNSRREPMNRVRKNVATIAGMRALRSVPNLGPLRLRRWRRGMVGALTLGWALATAVLLAPAVPAVLRPAPIVLVLLVWMLLVLTTRNIAQTVDAFADERDRAVRDRAHRVAYWILAPMVGAAIGWLLTYALSDARELTLGRSLAPEIAAVCWTLFLLYSALPVIILAWTEPDPLDHDGVSD
jgi:MFS-type transporter involved in bile tolerance (Atg22 family)